MLLRFLRIVLSIIAFGLAIYGLITQNFEFHAYMILFLGLSMLVMGIQEFQQNKKPIGWLLIVVFAFSLFVSIQKFILH